MSSSIGGSSPGPVSAQLESNEPRRCTLCKALVPLEHLFKRCDLCRVKIKEQGERRKARKSQSISTVTLPSKRKADDSDDNAIQNHVKKIKKEEHAPVSTSRPRPMCYTLRHMDQLYEALAARRAHKIHVRATHSIVADAEVDDKERAKMVATQIQQWSGVKLGKGKVDRKGAYTLIFTPEPSPSRLNGTLRIEVKKDMSHTLFPGQKISVEMCY